MRGRRQPVSRSPQAAGWQPLPMWTTGLKAFLRSLWFLGVRYPGRLAYWRFLLHTLVRYPREFGQAVALAIYGHHFRMVAANL